MSVLMGSVLHCKATHAIAHRIQAKRTTGGASALRCFAWVKRKTSKVEPAATGRLVP
jgi:hypothetical protein